METLQNSLDELSKEESKRGGILVGWYKCKDWKMVASRDGSIFEFTHNVSAYHMAEDRVFVGNFEGELITFDRGSMSCLERINVGASIKNINYCYKYIVLCLQDDSLQIIEQSSAAYLNIIGHKSFTSHAQVVDLTGIGLTLFATSFDGCFSFTKLPPLSNWRPLRQKGGGYGDTCIDLVFQLTAEGEEGIGSFMVVRDMVLTATLDNYIKLYRLVAR